METASGDDKQMTTTMIDENEDKEESHFSFHDRAKEISLMLKDVLIYRDHLNGDKLFLKKLRILGFALDSFNDDITNVRLVKYKSK